MALSILVVIAVSVIERSAAASVETLWKEEIIRDWNQINHSIAFRDWQQTFNKTYTNAKEEEHRFLIFLDNWKMINDHNLAAQHRFTMRLNQFGDLTASEFRFYVNGPSGTCFRKTSNQSSTTSNTRTSSINLSKLPSSVDWTNLNGSGKSYVTPVKNQGKCGSCWAFSATGSIESHTAIQKGQTGSQIVSLSEQELLDCSSSYGNEGCNGGQINQAFKYVIGNQGICTEQAYPYTAAQGTCQRTTCGTKHDAIESYTNVKADNEQQMMEALTHGPVSMAVEADQSAFQFYSGGILDGLCGTKLDHAVLMVGYGTESGMDYWKVKNSWGDSWGEAGYVLICRSCNKNGDKGECGVLMQPLFPNV